MRHFEEAARTEMLIVRSGDGGVGGDGQRDGGVRVALRETDFPLAAEPQWQCSSVGGECTRRIRET